MMTTIEASRRPLRLALALALAAAAPLAHAGDAGPRDFGLQVEQLLNAQSERLFGVGTPLAAPATDADVVPRELARAGDRQLLAKGLRARFVARNVARLGDMIAFWPTDTHYSHLIVCIEQGRSGTTPAGNGGLNAAVQRVDVRTGEVATILHGMSRCDGIRTTQWGTVLATEETGDGRGYEIEDPLGTTGHWVADRATGDVRDAVDSPVPSTKVVQRQALPTLRWEGLSILDTGVVYAGDELRPGDAGLDVDGGAIFKFVPDNPFQCAEANVRDGQLCSNATFTLAGSPFESGRSFAFTASCRDRTSSRFPQYGQGCEIGEGAWVQVEPLNAPADAFARGATGYYRPEDLHADPSFGAFAGAPELGVRLCWTDTGNEGAQNFAETLCMVDEDFDAAGAIVDDRTGFTYLADGDEADDGSLFAVSVANRFVEGDTRFNSHDNLAINPVTGHVYVIEDHDFGEVFACLPDGDDRDLKSDGCVSILSVADPDAEPTGFIFDGTGRVAYYILQHGQQPAELLDFASNPVDGTTDDLVKITGFDLPKARGDRRDDRDGHGRRGRGRD